MKITPVVKGLLTLVPGISGILPKPGTGGTNSALYCYEVWLKHLTMLWENGMRFLPNTLAELGPGDSLGVGPAAMLSGINNNCWKAAILDKSATLLRTYKSYQEE